MNVFLLTLIVDGQEQRVQLRYKDAINAGTTKMEITKGIGSVAFNAYDDYGQSVYILYRHLRGIVLQDVTKTFEGIVNFGKLQAAAQARASAGGPSLVVPGQGGVQFHQ